MISLSGYFKAVFLFIWGSAIAFRAIDIRETGIDFLAGQTGFVTAIVRADAVAILLSLVVVMEAMLLLGRVRRAWLLLSVSIVVSKIIVVIVDARVGDLPFGDLAAMSLVSFLFPAAVLVLMVRSRRHLEGEARKS